MKKTIFYWGPFLTPIATPKAIVNSAKSLQNYGKKYDCSIINFFGELRAQVKLNPFKHTGIFPEQYTNWQVISQALTGKSTKKVLNLFGYTGCASLVAASAGAEVVHVDSSKSSIPS